MKLVQTRDGSSRGERRTFTTATSMRRNSIQILSLEVVLQRLHLQHGGKDQDADLEDRPPHGRDVYSFGFSMKPDLLLLHVVRLVEDLRELVVELDDLDLEPVLRVAP